MGEHHGHHLHRCHGRDHHTGAYTDEQRADLDRVLAFNRRMAEAIDAGLDTAGTEAFLDPDPLRYMWVDEGQGRIGEQIEAAEQVLAVSPPLPGHHRRATTPYAGSVRASRPSVAFAPDGSTGVVTWVEWVPGEGEVVRAALLGPDGAALHQDRDPDVVTDEVRDVFRPTAAVTPDGTAWVFHGASVDGVVGIRASHRTPAGWSAPEPVSGDAQPAFNQEAAVHADGRLELVWQAGTGNRFRVLTRSRPATGGWGPVEEVTHGVEANVWDPAVAAFADGSTAYAWSEYRDGGYRVAVRRRGADGGWGPVRRITGGSDYALHPHLAVTADQRLWCAFDVITVHGHAGSGPTRLRPYADLAADPGPVGIREAGESVPPELLPEVSAGIRVVAVDEDGVRAAPGALADRLDVVPSGMPRLAATRDGGLAVAYRVHRRLPLMTYYWEVAGQVLGPDGWSPPDTWAGTDGTLEEPSLAATADGCLLVAQTDARLERALTWTEGFGGRECPDLVEHHGSVVWHPVHGDGRVVAGVLSAGGPVPDVADRALGCTPAPLVRADVRVEARRWAGTPTRRRVVEVGDRSYGVYWGDLHRHSLVSRCTAGDEPSLEDFYRYAWDVCEYDFWAVTDHSENSSDYQWWSIQKIADLFHVPGRFVPLYGFEWTSADTGHQNVIYGDVQRGAPIFSAFAEGTTDPAGLWAALAEHPAYPAVTIPHHPGAAMVHNDWDYHDPRYSRLVEVFQACRGNYEADGCFRQYADGTRLGTFTLDGLRRGLRFGLIASSDHGHGASYVGALATSLDRGSVFEALHARRTFAATTRDVVAVLTMGPVLMGEVAPPGTPRTLTVEASGYADLARVDLLRDGEVVHALLPEVERPPGWLVVPLRLEWGGASGGTTVWDGELAVDGGCVLRTPYWSPEVVAATDERVAWRSTAHSFGEPYGAQRGGVEVTLLGPPAATVTVVAAGRREEVRLGDLAGTLEAGGAVEVPGTAGRFRLQPGIGGLTSLGVRSTTLTWTDGSGGPAFYYARVFLVDGEMAWSSPIWVDA